MNKSTCQLPEEEDVLTEEEEEDSELLTLLSELEDTLFELEEVDREDLMDLAKRELARSLQQMKLLLSSNIVPNKYCPQPPTHM